MFLNLLKGKDTQIDGTTIISTLIILEWIIAMFTLYILK